MPRTTRLLTLALSLLTAILRSQDALLTLDVRGRWICQDDWIPEKQRATSAVHTTDTETGAFFGVHGPTGRALWTLALPRPIPISPACRLIAEIQSWGMPPDGRGMVVGLVVEVAGRIHVVPAFCQQELGEDAHVSVLDMAVSDCGVEGTVRGLAIQIQAAPGAAQTQAVVLRSAEFDGVPAGALPKGEGWTLQVQDPEGRGIPRAALCPLAGDGSQAETDRTGRAALPSAPPAGSLCHLRISGTGVADTHACIRREPQADPPVLRVLPSGRLGGRVARPDGTPLAAAAVHLWTLVEGQNPGAAVAEDLSTFTGKDGTWSMACPAEHVEAVWLRVHYPGLASAEDYLEGADQRVRLLRGDSFETVLAEDGECFVPPELATLRTHRLMAMDGLENSKGRLAAAAGLREVADANPRFGLYVLDTLLAIVLAEPDEAMASPLARELYLQAAATAGHPSQAAATLAARFPDGTLPPGLAKHIALHHANWLAALDQALGATGTPTPSRQEGQPLPPGIRFPAPPRPFPEPVRIPTRPLPK